METNSVLFIKTLINQGKYKEVNDLLSNNLSQKPITIKENYILNQSDSLNTSSNINNILKENENEGVDYNFNHSMIITSIQSKSQFNELTLRINSKSCKNNRKRLLNQLFNSYSSSKSNSENQSDSFLTKNTKEAYKNKDSLDYLEEENNSDCNNKIKENNQSLLKEYFKEHDYIHIKEYNLNDNEKEIYNNENINIVNINKNNKKNDTFDMEIEDIISSELQKNTRKIMFPYLNEKIIIPRIGMNIKNELSIYETEKKIVHEKVLLNPIKFNIEKVIFDEGSFDFPESIEEIKKLYICERDILNEIDEMSFKKETDRKIDSLFERIYSIENNNEDKYIRNNTNFDFLYKVKSYHEVIYERNYEEVISLKENNKDLSLEEKVNEDEDKKEDKFSSKNSIFHEYINNINKAYIPIDNQLFKSGINIENITGLIKNYFIQQNLINASNIKLDYNQINELRNIFIEINSNESFKISKYFPINKIVNISLSSEKIKNISKLIYFPSLIECNFTNNNISSIVNTGKLDNSHFLNLQIMNLSANNISSSISLLQYVNLKRLNLSYNSLTHIPFLPNSIKVLNLQNNKISYIENIPFSIEEINLTSNNILILSNMNDRLYLKRLYIGRNYIESIDNIQYEVPFIEEIYLYNNKISFLPLEIFLPFIKILDLQNNFIEKLESSFFFPCLRVLNLQNNHITYMRKSSMSWLYSIVSVDLSFNRIKHIETIYNSFILPDSNDFRCFYIEKLNVLNNQFDNIDNEYLNIRVYKFIRMIKSKSNLYVNPYTYSNRDCNTTINSLQTFIFYMYNKIKEYSIISSFLEELDYKLIKNTSIFYQLINSNVLDGIYNKDQGMLSIVHLQNAVKNEVLSIKKSLFNHIKDNNQYENKSFLSFPSLTQIIDLLNTIESERKFIFIKNIKFIYKIQKVVKSFLFRKRLFDENIHLKYIYFYKHINKIRFIQFYYRFYIIKRMKRQMKAREKLELDIEDILNDDEKVIFDNNLFQKELERIDNLSNMSYELIQDCNYYKDDILLENIKEEHESDGSLKETNKIGFLSKNQNQVFKRNISETKSIRSLKSIKSIKSIKSSTSIKSSNINKSKRENSNNSHNSHSNIQNYSQFNNTNNNNDSFISSTKKIMKELKRNSTYNLNSNKQLINQSNIINNHIPNKFHTDNRSLPDANMNKQVVVLPSLPPKSKKILPKIVNLTYQHEKLSQSIQKESINIDSINCLNISQSQNHSQNSSLLQKVTVNNKTNKLNINNKSSIVIPNRQNTSGISRISNLSNLPMISKNQISLNKEIKIKEVDNNFNKAIKEAKDEWKELFENKDNKEKSESKELERLIFEKIKKKYDKIKHKIIDS